MTRRRPKPRHPRRSQAIGVPAGTLTPVHPPDAPPVTLTAFSYDAEGPCEVREVPIDGLAPPTGAGVTWINVDGIHRTDVIEKIGAAFGVHPLLLEDIHHADQRPKTEDYGDYIYVVMRMWHPLEENGDVKTEQVSLLLGDRWVITFQEDPGDVFDPIRQRLRENKGRVRHQGADFLAYALIDVIVDHYYRVLEQIGDRIEDLERDLVDRPGSEVLQRIYDMKRNLIMLRKSAWPLREVVSGLLRGESRLFQPGTLPFLRDVHDHVVQVIDTVETLRDLISGMLDIYLSSVSHRLNEVMKLLTIIATIFIPLTFIVGVYGMNFRFMPELEWRWGYPVVWGGMLAVGLSMVVFFRKRGWL